ncbi:pyridoxamine 5'-phosphate oxidase family protein [Natrialbaceae archaeon AArc-T1-2]|uniref:pyridoxamine 5'-phosphate oxidase family protein n=1 Tax=Natrialbaceae archaeon AArc-T1-2 TaxID=3053904 RepID=UPI00255A94AD|nr:pyridoxamine 5'-phosphate oxidase family protein [Natrialbaceae archaeon AArc-T1-2]WIV68797.1 pyridoxamine 5'-phosphate oxidase family protein [Natrialbaceae archaeon AArc-T1-2]
MGDIGEDMAEQMAEQFFASRGHGVLSLADENTGYGIPISYGYDPTTSRCVIQLVSEPESQKRSFFETSETVTLTTYDYDSNDNWQSAIATGSLVSLSDEEVATWAAAVYFNQAAQTDTPVRQEGSDREISWHAFEVDSLTGRQGTEERGSTTFK